MSKQGLAVGNIFSILIPETKKKYICHSVVDPREAINYFSNVFKSPKMFNENPTLKADYAKCNKDGILISTISKNIKSELIRSLKTELIILHKTYDP